MLKLLKIFGESLIAIHIVSFLLTGNTKIGTRVSMNLIKLLNGILKNIFKISLYQCKVINKLVHKLSKSTHKIKDKKDKQTYQKAIRTYNNKVANGENMVVDMKTYIKTKN